MRRKYLENPAFVQSIYFEDILIDPLAYPIRYKKVEDSKKNDLLIPNCAKPGTNNVKLSETQASGAWGVT